MKFLNEVKKIVAQTAPLIKKEKQTNEFFKKGDFNFVTAVDIKVQEFLREKLVALEPSIQMFSEEADGEGIDWTKPAWVLDPVDGTTNLMHAYHEYSVSLALWDGVEVSHGIVFNVVSEEMFSAKRGSGAYLGDERLSVSKTKDIADSLIAVETAPYNKELANETFGLIKDIFLQCRDIRCAGSTALAFAYMAAGRTDAVISRMLHSWDFAAGWLIILEAGGCFTNWEGDKPPIWHESLDVVAGNEHMHSYLLNMINGK